jgi:MoxR-like ATPase
MLILAARGHAFLQGRDYVLPEDVQSMFGSVLAHRLILRPESRLRQRTVEQIMTELVRSVNIPQS